jgi:hypothetical protein
MISSPRFALRSRPPERPLPGRLARRACFSRREDYIITPSANPTTGPFIPVARGKAGTREGSVQQSPTAPRLQLRCYGQPAPAAGASVSRTWPVPGRSNIFVGPFHSVAIMNGVFVGASKRAREATNQSTHNRKRPAPKDDLRVAGEIDRNDLLRAPIGEPKTALVPTWLLAEHETGHQRLNISHGSWSLLRCYWSVTSSCGFHMTSHRCRRDRRSSPSRCPKDDRGPPG